MPREGAGQAPEIQSTVKDNLKGTKGRSDITTIKIRGRNDQLRMTAGSFLQFLWGGCLGVVVSGNLTGCRSSRTGHRARMVFSGCRLIRDGKNKLATEEGEKTGFRLIG